MIDAFGCSNCGWTLSLPQPKPYLIARDDAEYACRKFDDHQCGDFNNAKRKMRVTIGPDDDGVIVTCSACDWVLVFRVSTPSARGRRQINAEDLFRPHRCIHST